MKKKIRVKNAFREAWDWFHALIGFLAVLVARFGFWFVGLAITLIFIAYESLQAESPESSYFDLVEFLCGAVVGYFFSRILASAVCP